MAKWNGRPIHAIELKNDTEELPKFAKKLAGQTLHGIGLHFYSSGYPRFSCGEYRLDNGYYMVFDEAHIEQFIYEGNM